MKLRINYDLQSFVRPDHYINWVFTGVRKVFVATNSQVFGILGKAYPSLVFWKHGQNARDGLRQCEA